MSYLRIVVMLVVGGFLPGAPTRGADPEYRRIDPEEARARVKLLESAYLSTLQHMHRRYFDGNERAPVPSNVLEDIFRRVDSDNGTKDLLTMSDTPSTPSMEDSAHIDNAILSASNSCKRLAQYDNIFFNKS